MFSFSRQFELETFKVFILAILVFFLAHLYFYDDGLCSFRFDSLMYLDIRFILDILIIYFMIFPILHILVSYFLPLFAIL